MSPPGIPHASELEICAWCPKLCRHVCPVAVGGESEAAAPSNMALHPVLFLRGSGSLALALDAAALCVECGACTAHCDLDRPLGDLLGRFRRGLSAPPPAEDPQAVEGQGDTIAVLSDDRDWSAALAAALGEPVATLRTHDHLGADHLDHPLAGPEHAQALRKRVGKRTLVVTDHRSLRAARQAGLNARHLVDVVRPEAGGPVFHPCHGPRLTGHSAPDSLACCGANGALRDRHPDTAARVAANQAARLSGADAPVRCPDLVCAAALADAGLAVIDPVDMLLSTAD